MKTNPPSTTAVEITAMSGQSDYLVSVSEERAENLSRDELLKWTVLSQIEKQIVTKLTGPGAKLISGPRGSGKSTLLKIAFYELVKSHAALPVYVNFSRALALEPLFHTHADATRWFRQWVLAKIVVGIGETCNAWPIAAEPKIAALIETARVFIASLEAGRPPADTMQLTPSSVADVTRALAAKADVARSVLLLDDAAHAFSVKQQREFFEVFRELRSREISAKAAIYPGVTSFSPSFQIGHEAEEIEAWIRPDNENYSAAMRQIASRRFPSLEEKLGSSYHEIVDVLGLASFGLPRGFVNMVSEVIDSIELAIPPRKAVIDAIGGNAEGVLLQFSNVADKLPRFANYVNLGLRFEAKSRAAIREFNKAKSTTAKTATLGLAEPWDVELDRVLRFMEYAGMVRRIENLSKGVKGNYQRYVFHYSRIIATNSLSLGKNYKLSDVVVALKKPSAHSLIKTKPVTLLGANYSNGCVLALPACPKCGTSRVVEEQKFCMNCGHELRSASIYLELLKAPVSKLPIPDRKRAALFAAGFATVGQLLSDERHKFKRPGSSIGAVWARRIINVAEEFVSV